MFGSIKNAMIEYFDERYAALFEAAAAEATVTVSTVGVGSGQVL